MRRSRVVLHVCIVEHHMKRKRIISVCKTCTWRIVASLDTFLLSWLVTGNVTMGASIASLEVVTKMFLYYVHERQWEKPKFNSYIISLYKQFSKIH